MVRNYSSDNSLNSGGKGSNLTSLSCEVDTISDDGFTATTLEGIKDVIPQHTNITVRFTEDSKTEELVIGEKITLRFLNLESEDGNYTLYLDSPNTIEKDGKDLLNRDATPIWPPSGEDSKN